jgi:long-chain acyl-CoA synthetase
MQPFPVAIVVPDPDVLPGWAKNQGIDGSLADLCKNKVRS